MDSEYERKIGRRIKQLRENRKITQEQLSARMQVNGCDITRSALAKIEVGQRHIYCDEIKCIKDILDVSYSQLFE